MIAVISLTPVPVVSRYPYSCVVPVTVSIVTIRSIFFVAFTDASCASGACMIPTSVLPSGVIASPSIPLFATRPLAFALISVAPFGLSVEIPRFAGSANAFTRLPVARSN